MLNVIASRRASLRSLQASRLGRLRPHDQAVPSETPTTARISRSTFGSSVDSWSHDARAALPLPPVAMRTLVGQTDEALFNNPDGAPVIPGVGREHYRAVLDFGCGCGRIARQLIQQRPPPTRYDGLDLHPGMIRWCQTNLAPRALRFNFHHHDVYYPAFNPGDEKPLSAPFPFGDGEFTLVLALSVFTHLTQEQSQHYFAEVARVLGPDGIFVSTWFVFDKRDFPMMQDEQNTLFINGYDIRNAVIYDRAWLSQAAASVGLTLYQAEPPDIRGMQWSLRMTRARDAAAVEIPEDFADRGRKPPPQMPENAERIGLS